MFFNYEIVFVLLIVVVHSSFGSREQLQIAKVTSDYLETEANLWRAIDRRAENTLEQIYYNHKSVLSENLYQNYAARNRISLNGTLDDGILLINETSSKAFGLLKNRDYGGLNGFVRGAAESVILALDDITGVCDAPQFWVDLKSVSFPEMDLQLLFFFF